MSGRSARVSETPEKRTSIYERARRAEEIADAHYEELRASWLARSRRDAVRRWEDVLGPTEPEAWLPVEPDPYERNHLRIRVDGLAFTQEHGYWNGQHHYWLLVDGSDQRIENALTLAHALADRAPAAVKAARRLRKRWWRR